MPLPSFAAWRHQEASTGFEVVFIDPPRFEGATAAVEAGEPFAVRYAIELDDAWRTRRARVWSRSRVGEREIAIEAPGHGEWRIDGRPAPHLSGCLDVDLEAS